MPLPRKSLPALVGLAISLLPLIGIGHPDVGAAALGSAPVAPYVTAQVVHYNPNNAQTSSGFGALSCPAPGQCVAVGGATVGAQTTQFEPAAAVENGQTWLTSDPLPAIQDADLSGVSCPAVDQCTAIGRIGMGALQDDRPLAVTYSNGSWVNTLTLPLPPGASGGQLGSISCLGAAGCLAVGTYATTSGSAAPLVETLSGGAWTASAPSLPGGMASVDCVSALQCVAVGGKNVGPAPGGTQPVVYLYSGGTWTSSVVGTEGFLFSVSCPSLGNCVAVGEGNIPNVSGALVETEINGTWSAFQPPGLDPLTGVSCAGGACQVTGESFRLGSESSFGVGTLNGQSVQMTPIPIQSGYTGSEANAIACLSATLCQAVGAATKPGQLFGLQQLVADPEFITSVLPTQGYWETASDGGIFAFGTAQFYGSMGGQPLNRPIVGIAATPDDHGYWEVASDGGIFSFGDAQFSGSMGGQALNQPIVGMAGTPDGHGYWEVASDGGIFSFGTAQFYGSMGGQPLNQPIVGIAATPDGQGYWEVASDGGIFSFGTAQFYGSMGGQPLNKPIVGIAATPDGQGYWEVASDGGIFSFGTAQFYGSTGSIVLNQPIVAMNTTQDGAGYRLVAADGGVFSFGDGNFYGSMGGLALNLPVVGAASEG